MENTFRLLLLKVIASKTHFLYDQLLPLNYLSNTISTSLDKRYDPTVYKLLTTLHV